MATDNNDFTHEFQIYSTDKNAGTIGTGKFLLFDNNINAVKVETIDNIKIGGGSNGKVLATDGEGNLRWISAAAVTGGISSYNDLEDLPTLFSGDYNDLTNKPTIPSLTGYATEAWVNSQGFITSVDTGNFTFTNNTITTDNGQDDIVLSIQGYDATQPTPNLVDFSWTFDTRGGLTLPSNLFFAHAYFTAEDDEQIFAGNTNKDFRLRTMNNSVPGINDWIFDIDGTLTVPGTITKGENLTLNSGGESGYTAAVVADGDAGRVFLRTDDGTTLRTWEFDINGNLKLPAGGDIVDSAGNSVLGGSGATNEITNTDPEGPTYSVSVGTDGVVTMVTSRGNLEFGALPEPGAPTHFHIMRPAGQEGSTDLYFGDDYNYVKLPSSSYSQQGVEIGSSLNQGAVSVWRFGTDGALTLPAGGDIKDSNGTSVLGGSSITHMGNTNTFMDVDTDDDVVRMQTTSTNYVGDYTFNVDNSGFTSATWNDNSIVIAGPSVDVYTAVWALTDFSSIFVTIGGVEYQIQNGGSSTPGHPQDVTLWTNNASPVANAVIDSIYIEIRTGEETFIEVDGNDIRMEAGDDVRIYAKDTFELVNRSGSDPIQITVDDNNSSKTFQFKVDGNLELPSGGTIVDSNGNDLLSGGSSGWGPGNNIVQNVDTDLRLVVQDPNEDSYRLDLAVEDDAGNVKTRIEMDYEEVQIETGNGQNQWRFESNGEFRIPGNINTFDADINIIAMNAGGAGNITIKAVSNVDDIHYSQVQLTQNGVTVTTDMDNTPGGKSFEFRDTGVLALPAGGDIVDSNGASVLGGGGTTLPADASGYLNNDGSGTLTWVPGNPSGSGMLPYNAVTVVSNTTTADWTEFTLSGTMDSMWDYNNTVASITLSSATTYGRTATPNTKNMWVVDAKVNSNNYLVIEFPTNPTPGDVFTVTSIVITQTVNAGSFVVGESYTITSLGNTDWMSIGAQYSGIGQTFVATGVGSGTGTATTPVGAKKLILKPATGQRARTMSTGQNGPVMFGQGGTYDFMFLDYSSQNVNSPITWAYAGIIDGIPTWYHTYF